MSKGTILVTGAAKRVGAVIAARLAREGWRVALHCHASRKEAEALAASIKSSGGEAEIYEADLSNEASIDAMAQAVAARGDWVGLVNNASSFTHDDIGTFALDPAAEQVRVNLLAPVYLARRFAEHLPAGRSGFVVNISDQKVLNPNPDFLSYTLAKIALAHATETLAIALASRIRVNCVAPGLLLKSGDQTPEQFARVHDKNLLQRGTTPEDVAHAVAYLADAENVTGALIAVDGGQHLVSSARDVMFT